MQATEASIGSEQCIGIRVRQNETWDLQDVLSRCMPSFYRRAYRYLGNAADAEDAVQDALLSAYKHLDQFKGQAQLSTWLTAIVTNCARMQLCRRPRQTHLSLDERFGEEQEHSLSELLADRGPSPEDKCRESELHGHLMQFVAELSPSLRRVFELRDLDELTTSEASRTLGLTDGTVKGELSRARVKLRRLMRRARVRRPRPAPTGTALRVVQRKQSESQLP
jgi:RNA polymerase sigma-70 factor (ECF subfamily)